MDKHNPGITNPVVVYKEFGIFKTSAIKIKYPITKSEEEVLNILIHLITISS